MDRETVLQTAFEPESELLNKRIEAIPAGSSEIGIDLNNTIISNIIEASQVNAVDINKLNSFANVSRTRNELYNTLDAMARDTTLSSVLETYAEDATEMNNQGRIVWCESDDANIAKYVTYLLNSLCVDKHVFKWARSLCTYGDVYLRLYRESDVEDKLFNKEDDNVNKKRRARLNEDVNIKAYKPEDRYIHYLEQATNPAQIFELTRFGKTAGYIQTSIEADSNSNDYIDGLSSFNSNYRFNYRSNDVTLFPATEWVHGCLENDFARSSETVELFSSNDEESSIKYSVRRGQSLLYNSYKTWRELMLLENSVLLQRVTQSSLVRVIGVEVGDMPKENVQAHLMNVKQLIEQKASINVGNNMSEYSNPGPIINNVYIPTRNNQGVLSTQQIGGDVNIGELVDVDYYEDKLFGGLRVPKQYFGRVDDAAGFSGGQSLSLISSRYAKMIKRVQSVLIQMITDAINLILIDTENDMYINKFKIKMLAPTTQEEIDRRDNISNNVGLISDIMNNLADIEDTTIKLKIVKSLLSEHVNNSEVLSLIQDQIDALETAEAEAQAEEEYSDDASESEDLSSLFDTSSDMSDSGSDFDMESDFDTGTEETTNTSADTEDTLPSPEDIGAGDFSDSTNPEFN